MDEKGVVIAEKRGMSVNSVAVMAVRDKLGLATPEDYPYTSPTIDPITGDRILTQNVAPYPEDYATAPPSGARKFNRTLPPIPTETNPVLIENAELKAQIVILNARMSKQKKSLSKLEQIKKALKKTSEPAQIKRIIKAADITPHNQSSTAKGILKEHHEKLSEDPEHLSTAFIAELSGVSCPNVEPDPATEAFSKIVIPSNQ